MSPLLINSISLTRNSIYSLHLSYYSIDLSFIISSLILFLFDSFHFHFTAVNSIVTQVNFGFVLILFTSLLVGVLSSLLLLLLSLFLCDLLLESLLGSTLTELSSGVNGIKWLIFSEWMLFYACFWSFIHFRLIVPGFSLFFSYPLLSNYSFAIPLSNLLILVFSSIPIQVVQIFIKIGLYILTMEGLGQSISCGFLFIILQSKEFLYSYFSLSDTIIGCTFYFTTGLHGLHVFFGSCGWILIILFPSFSYFLSSSFYYFNSDFFIEISFSILFASYYWHFVDLIWLLVYLLFLS